MTHLNFEQAWKDINCLVPIYDDFGGNSTEIWLEGGDKLVITHKTKTVLKNLAKVFAVDITQLKRKYGVLIGKKTSAPLAFHPELILIPIKCREPLAKDEGATGYIVHNKVRDFTAFERNRTIIRFSDGSCLKCLQCLTSVNLAIAQAEIIARECRKNLQTTVQEKEELYRIFSALVTALEKRKAGY